MNGRSLPVKNGYVIEKTTGIVIKHNKLITAVREIDKATSPLAYFEIIFVVTPPGAIASKSNPTFNSSGRGKIRAKTIATKGNKIT